jgi:hypothetical protein
MEQGGKRQFPGQDVYVPWHLPEKLGNSIPTQGNEAPDAPRSISRENGGTEVVYQRYYHLFTQGELESLVSSAGGRVLNSGYDRDNHYCIITHQ